MTPGPSPRRRFTAWRTGLLVGYCIAMAMFLLVIGEVWNPDESTVVQVLALLIGPALIGGLPGLAIGLVIDLVRPVRPVAQQQVPPPFVPALAVTRRAPDAWGRLLEACEEPVRRAESVTEAMAPSPVRDWLIQIVEAMRAELPDARSLAETGRRLHPPHTPSITTTPLYLRLKAAAEQFAAAERKIADVVGQAAAQPDLGRVDEQLRLLEQQLPHLRTDS
ncbi:hypothetical protein [Allokutzneria oryzae]|uniref:Uncharacterized protein n=1 Tax=Allokutzneria oryzae TaxID=1378989 RepID=A0ABV6A8D0_9PSEU